MIHFKAVRWQNFLSTGNEFIEVQLDRAPSTLIVGQNGAGKSTLLDALSFGLFNKPHRDIKKDQLINSINKKQCVVEVEFRIGGQEFKIVNQENSKYGRMAIRSIKPLTLETIKSF